jgi:hypothetical protein
MAKAIILIFATLFCNVVIITKHVDAICCDDIKSEVEKKIEANKTLCAPGNTLPRNCCKDIADEVQKHVASYEALCPNIGKYRYVLYDLLHKV